MLARGDIDVAPCSSIEYARHAERYRLLPEVVIGSRGAVGSILLVGAPPAALDGAVVALTTSSATSVCLLKILLHVRRRVMPRFVWFDQGRHDPLAMGAAAHSTLATSHSILCCTRKRRAVSTWERSGLPRRDFHLHSRSGRQAVVPQSRFGNWRRPLSNHGSTGDSTAPSWPGATRAGSTSTRRTPTLTGAAFNSSWTSRCSRVCVRFINWRSMLVRFPPSPSSCGSERFGGVAARRGAAVHGLSGDETGQLTALRAEVQC